MIKNIGCFRQLCRMSCFLLCSFIAVGTHAGNDVIMQAKALQQSGKVQQAYQLLQANADEYAGDADFDYLLGKTAIDAGQPLAAVFALERVLDQNPDYAPARAELARAYFLIGENEAAKVEFKRAKTADMPTESKKLIDSYISTIDDRILGGITDSSFYISAGLGYDSNVNSATGTSQVAAPGGGTFFFPFKETDSTVALIQGGGQFSHAIKQHINIYGSADLRLYEAIDESDFSTQIVDGVVGLHFLQGLNQYRVSLVTQVFALDSEVNRNLLGLNGQWQRTIDAANQFTLFTQYASLRFPDAKLFDVNQISIGATWLHVFASSYQPVTYLTGYYGTEEEQSSLDGTEFIGRDYFGFRAGVRFKTSARLLWSTVLTYQQSEYGDEHPVFQKTREDDFINIIAGADYLFSGGWSVQPEITYSDNDSTLAISSYDRLKVLVTARKEF